MSVGENRYSASELRLQLAYADFTNDSLLLDALTRGICVHSHHMYNSILLMYGGTLLMPNFSAATFLHILNSWQWWGRIALNLKWCIEPSYSVKKIAVSSCKKNSMCERKAGYCHLFAWLVLRIGYKLMGLEKWWHFCIFCAAQVFGEAACHWKASIYQPWN